MTSRDEDFKALQLEMMSRYPHYLGSEELHRPHSDESVGLVPMSGTSEPTLDGLPGQQYGQVAESTSRRSSTGSYSETAKDLDDRERRKAERKSRHSREVLRDCLLILVEVVLVFVIILALAKYGYFGGKEDSKDAPAPYLDIKPAVETPRSEEKIIYRTIPATTPPGTVHTKKSSPTPGTETTVTYPPLDVSTIETRTTPEIRTTAPTTPQKKSHSSRFPPKGGQLRLIVDVDPGVDDSMALVFAFTSERATVDAITVVAGNAKLDTTYDNARRVLRVLEINDVPVYKGADRPIASHLATEESFYGPDSFGGVSDKYPVAQVPTSRKLAHVAIRDMVKQRPREYTLVLLGPLTNMATAMLMEPSLTDDVARIFILGGNIFGKGNVRPGSEFNFVTDPEAARVVLQRATCPVTVVTWEAILQATVPWDDYNEVTAQDRKLARFVRDINNYTVHCCLKNSPGFSLGDFLAMLAALVPDSVEGSIESRVDVEIHGEYTLGQMVHAWQPQHLPHIGHNVTVVYSFNKEMVTQHFRKVFETGDTDE